MSPIGNSRLNLANWVFLPLHRHGLNSAGALVAFCLWAAGSARTLEPIEVEPSGTGARFAYGRPHVPFAPHGANWVLLEGEGRHAVNVSFNDSAFVSALPRVRSMLREMRDLGYNVVRIRPDSDAIGKPGATASRLNADYIGNLITFLEIARGCGIRVELTGYWIPPPYYAVPGAEGYPKPQADIGDINQILMTEGLAVAHGRYLAELLSEIRRRSPAAREAVFSVDLWNELYFNSNAKPFSATDGLFRWRANGRTYDLGNAGSRQKLMDDATLAWINRAVREIRRADAEVLLTASIFSPAEVGRTGYDGAAPAKPFRDFRSPLRLVTLESSDLDFLEVHIYPHDLRAASVDADFNSMEWRLLRHTKPIVAGEFGAYRGDFPTLSGAIGGMKAFLAKLPARGVLGWMFWTWDTQYSDPVWGLWSLSDDYGQLARALSPRLVPPIDSAIGIPAAIQGPVSAGH